MYPRLITTGLYMSYLLLIELDISGTELKLFCELINKGNCYLELTNLKLLLFSEHTIVGPIMDLQSERLDSIHYTAWRTDRYKRFLPELALKSCKELRSEIMIQANPNAQSAADRLERMLYSANLNRNLVDTYLEELSERRDALREGQLEEAKMEDYRREILKSRLAHPEQKRVPAQTKETQPEPIESRFVLLNEMPVETYGKKDKKKPSIKRETTQSSLVRNKNKPVSPVFFTESPDKSVCVKKESKEGRWEPLSYTAMGDMGFNFRVAPGKGELWGKTAKMWKPINH